VIIIGAGASGIAAAQTLKQSHQEINVIIVEARDRIGGRIHTISLGDVCIDSGATWLHQVDNNPLHSVALQHNLTLVSR
jgi:monoamine oxidase